MSLTSSTIENELFWIYKIMRHIIIYCLFEAEVYDIPIAITIKKFNFLGDDNNELHYK